MQRIFRPVINYILLLICLLTVSSELQAQYARGNSPYSRFGFGDLYSGMFATNQSMAGSLAPTYRNFWNVNLVNPASFGQLRFTAFQVGINYEHHALSEKATGLTAQADNGNLNYISLAFPITKSWEVMKDTLRRGEPIQWGMGFSLVPYSTKNYDVAVSRNLPNVPDVNFNYTGSGNRYRVNWSNGISYKGISAGANIGLLFGQVKETTTINFQDSSFLLGYDEVFVSEENNVGFAWDVGVQYEYLLQKEDNKSNNDINLDFKRKITFGAYAGSISNLTTTTNEQVYRTRGISEIDSIRFSTGITGNITMPLKVGGGISIGSDSDWQLGASFESQLWSMYRVNGVADENLNDSWRVAVGGQWIPKILDYKNYFNVIRYRFGAHYGTDPRAILASDGNRYQLQDYGLSVGAGFPLRPPKSKSLSGFVNLGLEVGYMGHPELIGDVYFKVNLGFALDAGGWFNQSKFR
jgi:hypothetical protein